MGISRLVSAKAVQDTAVSAEAEARAAALVKRILGAQGIAHVLTVNAIDEPFGVAFEPDGDLVIAAGAQGLLAVDQRGSKRPLHSDAVSGWAVDSVAIASDGRLALVSSAASEVIVLSAEGKELHRLGPDKTGALNPRGVCFTEHGLAIADTGNDRVLLLQISEDLGAKQGEVGERAIAAESVARHEVCEAAGVMLSAPEGVAWFTETGTLAISDTGNHRVVLVDAAGSRAFGGRGPFAGQLCVPGGICADGSSLWIADRMNHRIIRTSLDGLHQTSYGLHSVRPREGGGAVHYPSSIAIRSGKTLAVGEPFERRVQLLELREPSKELVPPLAIKEGVSSHFGRGIDQRGDLLVAWEPEAEALVVFDCRLDVPAHITTVGCAGVGLDRFGRIDAVALLDNGVIVADGINRRLSRWELARDAEGHPRFDPFMAQLRATRTLGSIADQIGGRVTIRDMCLAPGDQLVLLDATSKRLIWLDAEFAPLQTEAVDAIAPCALSVAADGTVGVLDSVGPILRLSSGRTVDLQGVVRKAGGIEAGIDGDWIVTDALGDSVVRVESDGKVAAIGAGGTGIGDSQFQSPSDAACAADGRVCVLDMGNHRLQCFEPDGSWRSTFTLSRAKLRPRVADEVAGGGGSAAGSAPAPIASQLVHQSAELTEGIKAASADGSFAIAVRSREPVTLSEPFALEITLTPPPDATSNIYVDATMPHHGHGMNVRPAITRIGASTWVAEGMLFHMPGTWVLAVDRELGGATSRAQITLSLEPGPRQ